MVKVNELAITNGVYLLTIFIHCTLKGEGRYCRLDDNMQSRAQ